MKKKLAIVVIIIITVIIVISIWPKSSAKPEPNHPSISENQSPKIVSTKPDPLEEAIISANETVEITFNRPLENVGEFKVRLETKKDFKVELSPDRKTAKIIPFKPYELGTTYTLFIGPDTKFDGAGAWGQEKIFHFKTIQYRGV